MLKYKLLNPVPLPEDPEAVLTLRAVLCADQLPAPSRARTVTLYTVSGDSPLMVMVVADTVPLEAPLTNTSYPVTDWLSVEAAHDKEKEDCVMFEDESDVGVVGACVSAAADGYNLPCGMTCCD